MKIVYKLPTRLNNFTKVRLDKQLPIIQMSQHKWEDT